MRIVVLAITMLACGNGKGTQHDAASSDATLVDTSFVDVPTVPSIDAGPTDAPQDAKLDAPTGPCSPLTQLGCASGEKCTWIVDAYTPQHVGHVGCAPAGSAQVGEACVFGPAGSTGYDNCAKGLVCGRYFSPSPGVCKTICDPNGGAPACDDAHVCAEYSRLFYSSSSVDGVAGVCDPACDPLGDNDFDGSGSLARTSMTCGSISSVGCYGSPSMGTPPRTGWLCTNDVNYMESQPVGLRHRVQCTTANNCADPGPKLYVNSCNQGYLPLLNESTMVSTAICVAMCKPKNCYLGNCGLNDEDRLGVAPHRCNTTDRVGTFDTSANGEHCLFSWFFEIDDGGNFVRSPTSDTLGFCYDHSKYLYDSNGDNTPDAPIPACATLLDGTGSGGSDVRAGDFGCVDTTHAGVMFMGKPRKPRGRDGLRALYHRLFAP